MPAFVKYDSAFGSRNRDWGNYLADRAADKDYNSLRAKGFQIMILEVTALSLYNSLLEDGQWYIGYKDANPILPHGVAEHTQRMRLAHYLRDRDKDRCSRKLSPYWYSNSIQYSARAFHILALAPHF